MSSASQVAGFNADLSLKCTTLAVAACPAGQFMIAYNPTSGPTCASVKSDIYVTPENFYYSGTASSTSPSLWQAKATCPAGYTLIAGGGKTGNTQAIITSSRPVQDPTTLVWSWTFNAQYPAGVTPNPATGAFAICYRNL